MNQDIYKIAQVLTDLFYPLLEVCLLKHSGEEIAVYNRLDKEAITLKDKKTPYIETLTDGRKVKVAELVLNECYMRVRYDTSLFLNLQSQLALLIDIPKQDEEKISWEEQIDTLIHQFLKEHSLTVESAGRHEKRELIYTLYLRGLFKYKDAAHYVAKVLHLSRATVYNYLKWATVTAGINIHQVDAFTRKRFGGNPAGVVLDAEILDEQMMRKITREMNLSETAFVLPSKTGDFRLRYFTPTGDEVVFCGHSTVGSLYMLAHEKRMGITGPGRYCFKVETLAGLLGMDILVTPDEKITVHYETPKIDLSPFHLNHKKICEILDIDPAIVDTSKPVMFENTNHTVLMTIRSLEDLSKIQIDFKQAETFAREQGIVVYALLTEQTFDKTNIAHVRCFAPAVGIPEDPFTGSVMGGLAAYLYENQIIHGKQPLIGIEQGHFIKRPGSVKIQVKKDKSGYHATIVAHAVHLFSTQMKLR